MLRLLFTPILALIFSTVGMVFATMSYISEQRELAAVRAAREEAERATTEIAVVADDLLVGQIIKSRDFRWQDWPTDALISGYILKRDADEDELIGSVVRSRMAEGEPLLTSRIVDTGEQGFLAAVLAPGKRAVSIRLDKTNAMGGLLVPGDHVDVLLTQENDIRDPETGNYRSVRASQTIIQNVRVIAIDQILDDGLSQMENFDTATLEVTGKQAEVFALAKELGVISLSLRGIESAVTAGEFSTSQSLTTEQEISLVSTLSQETTASVAKPQKPNVVRGSD